MLTNTNTYTGTTTINGGTLALTGTGSIATSSSIINNAVFDISGATTGVSIVSLAGSSAGSVVLGNTALTISNAHDTFNGVISGNGSIILTTGIEVLTNTNTYTGGTSINGGTLALGANNVLADTGTITVAGGIFAIGAYSDTVGTLTLSAGSITGTTGVLTASGYNITNNTGATAISAILAGNANLTKSGAGSLTLSGTNTYSGTTTINGGRLIISADNNLGTAPSTATPSSLIFNNGTLETTATFTLNANRGINLLGAGTIIVDSAKALTYNGVIAGPGDFTKSGAGTLILGGTNTYIGATSLIAGTLNMTGALADVANIDLANGTTYIVSQADTINSVTGTGSVVLASNLTVGNSNTNFTFGGAFSGAGSLINIGTGSMTLAGSSTYTGNTVLNASTLILNNATALGSSAVISTAGTLQIASDLVLNSLHVTGPITISSSIKTSGAQVYDGAVTIAATAGQTASLIDYNNAAYSASGINLNTNNAAITFNGTINAASSKNQSLAVNAGSGTVTIGASVGSILPLQNFNITSENIRILADVKTSSQQSYTGTTVLGSNGVVGFLYSEFTRITRPSDKFTISDPLLVRTFVSSDPMVRFVGTINPEKTGYSLLIAAIYNGFVNGDPNKEPRVILNGLVGKVIPFYSVNLQAVSADDVFALNPSVGTISVVGVETTATQNYSANQVAIMAGGTSTVATFRASQPGNIVFDTGKVNGAFNVTADGAVTGIIIDGVTSFTSGIKLPGVRFPVREAEAARAASGGNLAAALKVDMIVAESSSSSSSSSSSDSKVTVSMSDASSDGDSGDSGSTSSSSGSGSNKSSSSSGGSTGKSGSKGKKGSYDGDDPNYDPDSRLIGQSDDVSLDRPDPVLNNALEGANMKCLKGAEDGCL